MGNMERVNCPCGNTITMRQRKHCSAACAARMRAERVETLFWSRVQKSAGCWTWTGPVGNHGYGTIARGRLAHRKIWAIVNGPIPKGMLLMHSCDNRRCVQPEHLSLGTDLLNMRDAKAKGRLTRAPYQVTNAKLTPDQVRDVRARAAAGETQRSLAQAFGMYQSSISAIVTRKWWREVA
jgi:hypothetical protein